MEQRCFFAMTEDSAQDSVRSSLSNEKDASNSGPAPVGEENSAVHLEPQNENMNDGSPKKHKSPRSKINNSLSHIKTHEEKKDDFSNEKPYNIIRKEQQIDIFKLFLEKKNFRQISRGTIIPYSTIYSFYHNKVPNILCSPDEDLNREKERVKTFFHNSINEFVEKNITANFSEISKVFLNILDIKMTPWQIWIALPDFFFCFNFCDNVIRLDNYINRDLQIRENEEDIENEQNIEVKYTKKRYSLSNAVRISLENVQICFFSEISFIIEERYKSINVRRPEDLIDSQNLEYKKSEFNILCLLCSDQILWYDIVEPNMSNFIFFKKMSKLREGRYILNPGKAAVFISEKKEKNIPYLKRFDDYELFFFEALTEHSTFNPVNILFKIFKQRIQSSMYSSRSELNKVMNCFFEHLKIETCKELCNDEVIKLWKKLYAEKLKARLRV